MCLGKEGIQIDILQRAFVRIHPVIRYLFCEYALGVLKLCSSSSLLERCSCFKIPRNFRGAHHREEAPQSPCLLLPRDSLGGVLVVSQYCWEVADSVGSLTSSERDSCATQRYVQLAIPHLARYPLKGGWHYPW